MRLIDADLLSDRVNDSDDLPYMKLYVDALLAAMPTIDPESLRPKGRWIMHDDEILGLSCECSACHTETCGDSPYCPNSGAKMEV